MDAVQDLTNIWYLRQSNKEWHQLVQLCILIVVVPGENGNGILGLQPVAVRWVVEQDDVFDAAPQAWHIFHVDAVAVEAMLTE